MTSEEGPGSWSILLALLALLVFGAAGPLLSGAHGGPSEPSDPAAWRGASDLHGPTIRDVRSIPLWSDRGKA